MIISGTSMCVLVYGICCTQGLRCVRIRSVGKAKSCSGRTERFVLFRVFALTWFTSPCCHFPHGGHVHSCSCSRSRSLFFVHAWQETGFTSNELFRVAHLLTVDAVNSCLNPIMRHDMQVSCSILKQVN